jgi:hypothetical protein
MPFPSLDNYTDDRHRCVSKAHTLMKALEAYSMRKLSFVQDALHAITGILKLFSKDGVYHIWGAPCFLSRNVYEPHLCKGHSWLDSKRPTRVVDLAILMDNWYPCKRRLGFPSWSPLGWSSPFQWTGGEGPDRLRTYPRYLTADASCINIRSGNEQYRLSDIVGLSSATAVDILEKASPYLEILGRTTTLRLVEPRRDRIDPSVAFAINDDSYAIFHPRWTVSPTNAKVGSSLKGLLLLGAPFMPSRLEHIYAMVLLLSDHGDHYEKVGDFELFEQLPPESSWEYWDNEHHVWHSNDSNVTSQLEELDLKDEGEEVIGEKQGTSPSPPAIEEKTEESGNASPLEEHPPEYWWWTYFTDEETIVLG